MPRAGARGVPDASPARPPSRTMRDPSGGAASSGRIPCKTDLSSACGTSSRGLVRLRHLEEALQTIAHQHVQLLIEAVILC